jgi:hypothetical protein
LINHSSVSDNSISICNINIRSARNTLDYLQDIVFSVLHRITDSEYPFVSSRHCDVCSSLIYGFWLPLCIFKTCCCLFFFDIRILITPLVSSRHYIVCSSLMYGFWLPLWYLQDIMLSVLLWNTDSDYPFGIFKTVCCLFFLDVRILITPLVSSRHYVVCSSLKYGFWLPLCIFKTLYYLLFFDIRILITPLVSSRHLTFKLTKLSVLCIANQLFLPCCLNLYYSYR